MSKFKRRKKRMQLNTDKVMSTGDYDEVFNKKKSIESRLHARISDWKREGGQAEELPDIIAIECIKISTEESILELLNIRAEVIGFAREHEMYGYLSKRLLELRETINAAEMLMNVFSTKKVYG